MIVELKLAFSPFLSVVFLSSDSNEMDERKGLQGTQQWKRDFND